MFLIFDTETTGLPGNYNAPVTDLQNWPRVVQLAWQLHDAKGSLLHSGCHIIKPEGFTIPFNAEKVHGISTAIAERDGKPLAEVLGLFLEDAARAEWLAGHNIGFDINTVGAEVLRSGLDFELLNKPSIDTKDESTDWCRLPGGKGGRFKWPTLSELHEKLFGSGFSDAHNAAFDVDATAKCFFELVKRQVIDPSRLHVDPSAIQYQSPDLTGLEIKPENTGPDVIKPTGSRDISALKDAVFCHLHVHSQFSVLQATPQIDDLVRAAKDNQMPAVALTDHGNLYGAFQFVREATKAGIKPILGCEFYVAEDRTKTQFTKDNPDRRFSQVLLAKNKKGYQNLSKLSSFAFKEGNYGLYPRIDKTLLQEYHSELMALTGGLSSEIPALILNVGDTQAEEAFVWWHTLFGNDFYVEINRHGLEEENRVNEVLLRFAKKYSVKILASNNVYYLKKEDAATLDIFLCVKEGEFVSKPVGTGRGFRYGFPNDAFYFKSQQEMKALFADLPEAITNISEVLEKIEAYPLERPVLLPAFTIPESFATQDDYLKFLTYEGAKRRYPEINEEIRARIDFELETIKKTGYPGYFLIVQDFTNKAREMGVVVGPGRGSAAGSVVAYCTGITNVDPIRYDLLFERFLNPDRVSLPDIDIDFDDDGREKVIRYVTEKYGKSQVAQIITYGTMAAKSSIRDTARVLELPLSDANRLASMVPSRPGTTLKTAFDESKELAEIAKKDSLEGKVMQQALKLEGSLRNTGIHPCGVIITPDDITNHVPVCVAKDSDLLVTQFDNSVVESAGMLKMDFLGLKTLTILKDTLTLIEKNHGKKLDLDAIPLDDEKTYGLFQRGETNGTFQFESPGMQKHLKNLKPDKFDDLIAMNALYRPGPMEYIPNFIARKHGKEPITYDLPEMEEYLKDTYGITVYQEQVMLLAQKLAGFSKGEADVLRKAMGKKQREVLDKMKSRFVEGCSANNHPKDKAGKIWKDWEAFAEYAFNKSHSTCYSILAFQTAYLKTHYPAEFMAAVLTRSENSIEKITFFMEECRRMGIEVLGPDVCESTKAFDVNKSGQIRFGLGAIKGTGEAAVESIITEREMGGTFKDVFDFVSRVNLRTVNKKTLECLAQAGAFDSFNDVHRAQYFHSTDNESGNFIEKLIKYGSSVQADKDASQVSLFGENMIAQIGKPKAPPCEPWPELVRLKQEKEVVGFYISGHPLDQYKLEISTFCNATIEQVLGITGKDNICVAGMVTDVLHATSKNGKPWGRFTLEDYTGSIQIAMFGETYLKFTHLLSIGQFLYIRGKSELRYNTIDQWEFKPVIIHLLSEVRSKLTKAVVLTIDPEQVGKDMVDDLQGLLSRYKGKVPVKVTLRAKVEDLNISLDLYSRNHSVEPDNDLIKQIARFEGFEVKLEQ